MPVFQLSKNLVCIALGWICLTLGVIGIFLPLLPTTPFALLAAFFFSKGSERLHSWLLRQPTIGPLIVDWQRHGVIKIRAKILSTALIIPLFAYTLWSVQVGNGIKASVGAIGIAVLCFIWSRPSLPKTTILNRWTAWFRDSVFPLWMAQGVRAPGGGFAEALSLEGKALDLPKRTMVQCRQIYSFRIAHDLGLCDPEAALSAIQDGIDFVIKNCSLPNGSYVHSVQSSSSIADAKADLYTQAFVLFGFAHASAALPSRRDELKTRAQKLLNYLRAERALKGGGYSELGSQETVYQSNPHMHLFEAAIAWMKIDEDSLWRQFADELVSLCTSKFIQKPNHLLCEHFDHDWQPIRTDGKFIFEPGHHFEWAWLMGQYQDLTNVNLLQTSHSLYRTAAAFVKKAYVIDEVWSDLTEKSPSSRFWPQCERIKAASQFGFFSDANAGCESLFTYFSTPMQGLWYDMRQATGEFTDQPAKASSLYHIVGAYEQFKRFF